MRVLLLGITLALTAPAARAQDAMNAATVSRMKDATAFIRIGADGGDPVASGSGFLIRTEGTTGYVVTNAHVITADGGEAAFGTQPAITVYFRSGTKAESKAVGEVVSSDSGRDLALLRVTNVANLPVPVALTADTEPFETMTVYIFGFPFGQRLALGKGNPPVNVGRGQVSSVRRNADDRLRSVLLDGALNPGNSGGPVVDAKGNLVGVARATIRGANIGFAIAVPELLATLDGQAEAASLTVRQVEAGAADIAVEVPLVDPLGRIKSVRLLHTQAAPKFPKTRRSRPPANPDDIDDEPPPARVPERDDEEFVYGPLEGADSLPLTVARQRATGRLSVAGHERDIALWCQPALVDDAGTTRHEPPERYLFSVLRGKEDGAIGPDGITFWGKAVAPDGDCTLRLRNGALIYEVPGTLHDLNVDIGKNNAPRVVQEVEGDFVARVKVTGTFDPGAVRTGPKSVPCNLGGLIVWLDGRNYIRLERGAMYRNNRVLGFLNFELREQGTRTDAHNKGGLNPHDDLWVRVERRGKIIAGSISRDGRDWDELDPMEIDWPGRLRVGTDAINSCGDAMTVRFEEFALAPTRGHEPRR